METHLAIFLASAAVLAVLAREALAAKHSWPLGPPPPGCVVCGASATVAEAGRPTCAAHTRAHGSVDIS